MLELKNITKTQGNTVLFKDFSLHIDGPGLYGLSGPTGCGKTSLLNIIGGIDTNFQGEVYFHQKNIAGHLQNYRLYHVGYLFQGAPAIGYLSAKEELELFTTLSSKQSRVDEDDLQALGIDFSLKTKISRLSGGQRQRLGLLACLAKQPEILLCDEPTSALDQKNAHRVMELLKREAKTKIVIIVSHDQILLEQNCDCIYYYQDQTFIANTFYSNPHPLVNECKLKKKRNYGLLKMIFKELQEKKSRKLLTVLSMSFCTFCFLITLLLSASLKKEVFYEIRKLFPEACLSIKLDYPITLDQARAFLDSEDHFYGGYLNVSQVELMGIKKIEDQDLLFISDATQIAHEEHLAYGRNPQNNKEVVLSKNTYEKLFGSDLTNQTIQAVYRYQGEDKAVTLEVVGVTNHYLSLDTIYEKNFAFVERIEELFNQKFEGDFLMAYYKGNLNEALSYLNTKNQHYEYKEVGKSFVEKINTLLDKINQILYLVCGVVLFSITLFLIMVVYLNTIEQTKQIGFLFLFGASKKQVYFKQVMEMECLGLMGVFSGTFLTKFVVNVANQFFLDQLGLMMQLTLDKQTILIVALLFIFLIYGVGFLPRFLIERFDLVDSLKQSMF
mgnify:CR=1 FL=1